MRSSRTSVISGQAAKPSRASCCSTSDCVPLKAPMEAGLSVVFMLVLLALAVPFWVVMGLGTVMLLLSTGALPLSLLGEALFDSVDSFALIAVPLFVLTGDVMVRSGL